MYYRISVVMSIYNNETTLRRAIDSILNQSAFDFELLLIDDGSTDGSLQICLEYAKKEPLLVEVIHHKERLGFAVTRNRGLLQAKGSYIYFADARNVFMPRMLEANLRLAEEQRTELVVFGFSQTDNYSQEMVEYLPNLPFLLSKERFRNHYRNFHSFYPYELCNKIFQTKYLRNNEIKFNKYFSEEKGFFNLDVYRHLQTVVFNRRSFCLKEDSLNISSLLEEKKSITMQIDLIHYLQELLIEWEQLAEYEDLIGREYYELLETEVLKWLSPHLNLSNQEIEEKVKHLLGNERIQEVLHKDNLFLTKNFYERALWNNFRNQNTRVIIELVHRKKQADQLTGNIKQKFSQWFQ